VDNRKKEQTSVNRSVPKIVSNRKDRKTLTQ